MNTCNSVTLRLCKCDFIHDMNFVCSNRMKHIKLNGALIFKTGHDDINNGNHDW